MGYHEKFEIVKNNIITQCKKDINDNWFKMFDMWLWCEADWEFHHNYKTSFNAEFEKYMTSDVELVIRISAKNIVYAIQAHMTPDSNLSDVLSFTHDFIEEQLNDFDNSCDDIMMAMYEESSDYERDMAIEKANKVDVSGAVIDLSGDVIDLSGAVIDLSGAVIDLSGAVASTVSVIKHVIDTLDKKILSKIKSNIAGNNLKDSKTLGIKGVFTLQEFISKVKLQNNKCYICLQDFKYDGGKWCNFFPSADRINNRDIHREGNIAISCVYCNIRNFKEKFTGKEIKKVCGDCPDLNHIYEAYIPTKSEVFRSLGNSNHRMYEYANNTSRYL
jgi:hypothetical protein